MSERGTDELMLLKRLWQCRACGDLVLTPMTAGPEMQAAQRVSVCGACGVGPYVEIGLVMPLQRLRYPSDLDSL